MAKHTLKIEFETEAQLEVFSSWLSNIGEQHYWTDCEHNNEPENIVDIFDYHTEGIYLKGNIIRATTVIED